MKLPKMEISTLGENLKDLRIAGQLTLGLVFKGFKELSWNEVKSKNVHLMTIYKFVV